ncbi:hypothetical protein FR932_00135 (plasmid) [Moritella marina ATCC 15381]|uniref:PIN-like domain-containing protein n=1 Tax=Moritella marina ATCC 15381 TaxID=1202962 RepID=A0A5J6WFP5_MORMI|nr:hypothetical protein [Moritella marina]QFI36334.1 hypothetical protein FR932_00135 [Moritella marina ATCC 15381]
MDIIFVDAENIGLKELEKLETSIIDKVFVFSKSNCIKLVCEKKLYLFLSDYPCGSNQADFYIIAYLSRVLSSLNHTELTSINFKLITNDESLISAFGFQCSQLGGISKIIKTNEKIKTDVNTVVQLTPVLAPKSVEEKIIFHLKSPETLNPEFRKKLGISQQDFSRATGELIRQNKIKRSKGSKKKWVTR